MSEVQFASFDKYEMPHVQEIARRAKALNFPVLHTTMNLAAVHHHTPLRLADLAKADDFNFAHDIYGIEKHLNKQTGELNDLFSPRFSA